MNCVGTYHFNIRHGPKAGHVNVCLDLCYRTWTDTEEDTVCPHTSGHYCIPCTFHYALFLAVRLLLVYTCVQEGVLSGGDKEGISFLWIDGVQNKCCAASWGLGESG